MNQIEFNVKKQMEECSEALLLCWVRWSPTSAPRLRHITQRPSRGAGGLARHGDALLT